MSFILIALALQYFLAQFNQRLIGLVGLRDQRNRDLAVQAVQGLNIE